MNKVLVMFATLALALASAADKAYHVTLNEAASVNGTQLQPGEYKLQIEGDKVVLKLGKKTALEAPAKVETADHKFETTSVAIQTAGSKPVLSEIRIGGTNQRVIFSGATAAGQ
jgi:hypothetical protein